MVRLVALAAASAAVGAGLWLSCRSIFDSALVQRRNHRGVDVPVGAGVVVPLAAVAVQATAAAADTLGIDVYTAGPMVAIVAAAAFGFCLLGLVDDLLATGDDRGFGGHLRALASGRLTTGGLKLVLGGLVAVAAVGSLGTDHLGDLAVGAVVVALAANLGNLFDRAPGRTTKVALVAAVALVAVGSAADRVALQPVVVVVAAGVGLLWFDLREQLMLGDAGANVAGAVLGLGLVATTSPTTQLVAAAALLAVNLASERWSFSSIIDRTPPLRAIDRAGRVRPDR